MISGRKPALLTLVVFSLLVFGYVFFGFGQSSASGGAQAFDLSPIETDAAVAGRMKGDSPHSDTQKHELPPESTLYYGGTTLSSEGQILGLWEPPGFFSRSNGSGIRSRTEGPLSSTDGKLLTVPAGATLKFRYGGEANSGLDLFDALALRLQTGSCGAQRTRRRASLATSMHNRGRDLWSSRSRCPRCRGRGQSG